MRRKRILFVAKYPMHYIMFRSVHEALRQDDRVQVKVLARMYGSTNDRALTAELGLDRRDLVGELRARHGRFDAVIAADYFAWNSHGAPKIQIFHGCSFKNAAIHEKALEWDHLFTIGPYMRRQFVEAGLFGADDPSLRLIGMPKLDRLAHGGATASEREAFLARHGLAPDKPMLLYAPTCHEHESSLGTFGCDLVSEIASRGSHNLLIKLHDHSLDVRYNERDWRAWRDEVCRAPGVAAFAGRDVTDALAVTDLLISDASSVAYEYAVRDRPIVFLETAIERPRSDLETFGRSIGLVARSVAVALAAIDRALADPAELSQLRSALVAEIFHQPGNATRNAIEAIGEVVT